MLAPRLCLVTFAALVAAGASLAQTDDTRTGMSPPPVPADIHAPGYADRSYLYEPRHTQAPNYPMTPNQTESPSWYSYPEAYRNGAPESYFNGGNLGARRDSNPDDFATGIYNPKP